MDPPRSKNPKFELSTIMDTTLEGWPLDKAVTHLPDTNVGQSPQTTSRAEISSEAFDEPTTELNTPTNLGPQSNPSSHVSSVSISRSNSAPLIDNPRPSLEIREAAPPPIFKYWGTQYLIQPDADSARLLSPLEMQMTYGTTHPKICTEGCSMKLYTFEEAYEHFTYDHGCSLSKAKVGRLTRCPWRSCRKSLKHIHRHVLTHISLFYCPVDGCGKHGRRQDKIQKHIKDIHGEHTRLLVGDRKLGVLV